MVEDGPEQGEQRMDQQQRPLACGSCDGLGVQVVPQGRYLETCERCKGTGAAEAVITAKDHRALSCMPASENMPRSRSC